MHTFNTHIKVENININNKLNHLKSSYIQKGHEYKRHSKIITKRNKKTWYVLESKERQYTVFYREI